MSCAPSHPSIRPLSFLFPKILSFMTLVQSYMQRVFVPLWVLLNLSASAQKKHRYHNRTHSFSSYFFPHCFLTYFIFCTLAPVPFSHKSLCLKKETSNLPWIFSSSLLALNYLYIYLHHISYFCLYTTLLDLFSFVLCLLIFSSPLHLSFSFNLFVLACHINNLYFSFLQPKFFP